MDTEGQTEVGARTLWTWKLWLYAGAALLVIGVAAWQRNAAAGRARLEHEGMECAVAYYQRLVRLDAADKPRTGEFERYAAFDRLSYREGIGSVRSFVVIRVFGTDASSMRVQLLVQHMHSERSEICYLLPSHAGWKVSEFGEGG